MSLDQGTDPYQSKIGFGSNLLFAVMAWLALVFVGTVEQLKIEARREKSEKESMFIFAFYARSEQRWAEAEWGIEQSVRDPKDRDVRIRKDFDKYLITGGKCPKLLPPKEAMLNLKKYMIANPFDIDIKHFDMYSKRTRSEFKFDAVTYRQIADRRWTLEESNYKEKYCGMGVETFLKFGPRHPWFKYDAQLAKNASKQDTTREERTKKLRKIKLDDEAYYYNNMIDRIYRNPTKETVREMNERIHYDYFCLFLTGNPDSAEISRLYSPPEIFTILDEYRQNVPKIKAAEIAEKKRLGLEKKENARLQAEENRKGRERAKRFYAFETAVNDVIKSGRIEEALEMIEEKIAEKDLNIDYLLRRLSENHRVVYKLAKIAEPGDISVEQKLKRMKEAGFWRVPEFMSSSSNRLPNDSLGIMNLVSETLRRNHFDYEYFCFFLSDRVDGEIVAKIYSPEEMKSVIMSVIDQVKWEERVWDTKEEIRKRKNEKIRKKIEESKKSKEIGVLDGERNNFFSFEGNTAHNSRFCRQQLEIRMCGRDSRVKSMKQKQAPYRLRIPA